MTSTRCTGASGFCLNMTNDPSGTCHHHRGGAHSNLATGVAVPPVTSAQGAPTEPGSREPGEVITSLDGALAEVDAMTEDAMRDGREDEGPDAVRSESVLAVARECTAEVARELASTEFGYVPDEIKEHIREAQRLERLAEAREYEAAQERAKAKAADTRAKKEAAEAERQLLELRLNTCPWCFMVKEPGIPHECW